MSFGIFLVCSFVLLGRPQDILPFLQPLRPALVITALAVAAMVFGARRQELSAALSTADSKRYLLFYLVMIIGIPIAYHRKFAFEGAVLGYSINMLFFVLLLFQVTSLQRLRSLLWVVCLSTVTYSVFGGLLQSGGFHGGRFEVAGTVFDPNDTAYVLLALFPLCLYFIRSDERLWKRLVAAVAVFSSIAVILQTGSRGGIVGLAAILLVLFLTKLGGIKRSHKIFVAAMLASAFLVMRDTIDVERYLTLTDVSSDYNVTSEEGGRLEIWGAAIDLILTNPLTGVGINCFPWAYYVARDIAGESYRGWHDVHNSYLQVAAEIGLIGFAIYILINLRSLITFFRASRSQALPESRDTGEIRMIGGLMLTGFAGLLVSGFFLSQAYSVFSTLYFALAAAMARLGRIG